MVNRRRDNPDKVTAKRYIPVFRYGNEKYLMDLPIQVSRAKIWYMYSDEETAPVRVTQKLLRRVVDEDKSNRGWVVQDSNQLINIDPSAFLGKDVVVVGENIHIGKNVRVEGRVVIGSYTIIYDGTTLVQASHKPKRFERVAILPGFAISGYLRLDQIEKRDM